MCWRARASRSGPSCFTTLEADQGRRPPSDGSGPMVMGDAGPTPRTVHRLPRPGDIRRERRPGGGIGTSAESYPVLWGDRGSKPVPSSGEPSELGSGAKSPTTVVARARNGKFESTPLQQRVRCELDLAARKSQKGQLGTRAASAAHAPRAAEAAARTQFSRSGSVEQPCIRPTRYIIPPTRARHPALGSTARTPLPGLTPRSPIG